NDVARSLADAGAPAGTLVLAEQQHAGRGRMGRSWSSGPGLGLYLSFVGRPLAASLATYPLRIGVAAATALDPWTAGQVTIKWPNDLLLEGRKLGGILCEASWAGPTVAHMIVGIGLNILHGDSDFPADLRPLATSLRRA